MANFSWSLGGPRVLKLREGGGGGGGDSLEVISPMSYTLIGSSRPYST